MKTLAPRGLDKGAVAECFEVLFQVQGDFDQILEGVALGRVQIKDEVIRLIQVRRAAMHLVKLNTGQVGQPNERSLLGGDHIIDLFFLPRPSQHDMFYPLRCPVGPVLLEESFALNAVRITHE